MLQYTAMTDGPDADAGREDFDVRMLGDGRPFVLEIINARAACPDQQTMTAMQSQLDEVGAKTCVHRPTFVLTLCSHVMLLQNNHGNGITQALQGNLFSHTATI